MRTLLLFVEVDMTRHTRTLGALLLAALGIVFATAPLNWIERRLGLNLDAGSGSLEFFIAFAPFVLALALAGRRFAHHAPSSSGADFLGTLSTDL
jgi:hypothetical protein